MAGQEGHGTYFERAFVALNMVVRTSPLRRLELAILLAQPMQIFIKRFSPFLLPRVYKLHKLRLLVFEILTQFAGFCVFGQGFLRAGGREKVLGACATWTI